MTQEGHIISMVCPAVSLTKIIFESSTKVRMTHFNVSVAVNTEEITM